MFKKLFVVLLFSTGCFFSARCQRNALLYVWMNHLANNYVAFGDGFLTINDDNSVTGSIHWTIKKRDGIDNGVLYIEQVQGKYDTNYRKFHLSTVPSGDSVKAMNRYDLALKPGGIIDGADAQTYQGDRMIKLAGNYFLSHVPRRVVLPDAPGGRLQGLWQKTGGKGVGIFANRCLEIFPNGVGISRNDSLNSVDNAKLFDWRLKGDSLRLSGVSYACHFDGAALTVHGQVYRRLSSNPLVAYHDDPSVGFKAANWVAGGILEHNTLSYSVDSPIDHHNVYFDVHPFTEQFGEIVQFSFDSVLRRKVPYGNMTFTEYYIGEGGEDSMVCLNHPYLQPFRWLFSDGVSILTSHDTTYYLLQTGPPVWGNLASLHSWYNANYFSEILSPPECKWVTCPDCQGEGEFHNGFITKHEIGEYDNEGRPIERTREQIQVCPKCYGNGGWYLNVVTGERIDGGLGWLRYFSHGNANVR